MGLGLGLGIGLGIGLGQGARRERGLEALRAAHEPQVGRRVQTLRSSAAAAKVCGTSCAAALAAALGLRQGGDGVRPERGEEERLA